MTAPDHMPDRSEEIACIDNSTVETFFKSRKAELVCSRARRDVETAPFEYINGFYNSRRKHSA